MRRIQWLLGVSLATAAIIVACGDSSTETPAPVTDAGQDTSVVDSSKPVVDSGVPDTAVADTGPAACTSDADLATLSPADAALGDSSVGSCVTCGRASCATQLTACQADCDCTNAVSCFYDCIGTPGASLLGCGGQCNIDLQAPGATQDTLLCVVCGCSAACAVPAQIVKLACQAPPTDGGTDSAPADAAADAPADAPADGG